MLKFAGFDHVVLKGKSKTPVYLWIHDGKAELRDADFLWGKTTSQTERALQAELNSATMAVASIGPAGENRVKGAGILNSGGRSPGDQASVASWGTRGSRPWRWKVPALSGSPSLRGSWPPWTRHGQRSRHPPIPRPCAKKAWLSSATSPSTPRNTPTDSRPSETARKPGGPRRSGKLSAEKIPGLPPTSRRFWHVYPAPSVACHTSKFPREDMRVDGGKATGATPCYGRKRRTPPIRWHPWRRACSAMIWDWMETTRTFPLVGPLRPTRKGCSPRRTPTVSN